MTERWQDDPPRKPKAAHPLIGKQVRLQLVDEDLPRTALVRYVGEMWHFKGEGWDRWIPPAGVEWVEEL